MVHPSMVGRSLAANAAFSLAAAAVMLTAAGPIGEISGIPWWWPAGVGIGLIPFGLGVLGVARDPRADRVRAVIVADLAWVVGAAVLIALPGVLSGSGRVLLAAVTAVVGLWATLQTIGLRRLPTGS